MDICTIIAKNYVAYARVLAKSFRRHHPDGRCFVLVIDDIDGHLDPQEEPFELLTPSDIDLVGFERMAARYEVLELSTAVKPALLRHLLHDVGLEKIAYLDPDIEVCASLEEIDRLLDTHEIALIPHLTEPIPDDGCKPSALDISIAGAYNLGFVALARKPGVDGLLDWWSERLQTECVVAPERGVFVDQRWMDFAPGFLEHVAIVRDPGYDVAYWNLHARTLRERDGRVFVNGSPLRFFHYSGFDPLEPSRLSKHQNRIQLDAGEPLALLCERYGEQVLSEGHRQTREWPYTYAELPGGIPLDRFIRAAYARAEEHKAVRRSIFTQEGADELLGWLTSPGSVGAAHGVNRYLQTLHELYPGLAQTFPDLAGRAGAELVAWARVYGRSEVPIPDALIPGLGGARGASRPQGVNLVGYFDAVLGVGEAARQVAGALQDGGIEAAPISMTASASPRDETLAERVQRARQARFPVNLICVNADMVPAAAQQLGSDFFANRYSIGYWWWELSSFPLRWLGSFEYLDEVWVGSRHVAEALAEVSPVPIVRIPPPVELQAPHALSREQLRLPEGFLFLFVWDYASVFERKNPLGAVEAFRRAFPSHQHEAKLVLKCINSDSYASSHEQLLAAVADRPDIVVIDGTIPRTEKDAMVAACDCFLSLHRSEGFGFTLAEAMWHGRPVIATGYSGNLDYMNGANSYLVDYELVPIGPGADPYPAEDVWAEPDLDHAAELMREVFEHPQAARARAARGRSELRRSHSRQAVGEAIGRRLERIGPAGARSRSAGPALVYGELSRTSERIRRGPVASPRARFGRLQVFARRLLLRVIKPFTVHERIVDEELVRAVAALGDSVAGAHMRIDELSHSNGVPADGQSASTPERSTHTPASPDGGTGSARALER